MASVVAGRQEGFRAPFAVPTPEAASRIEPFRKDPKEWVPLS